MGGLSALVLALALMAGCGGAATPTAAPPKAVAAPTAPSTAPTVAAPGPASPTVSAMPATAPTLAVQKPAAVPPAPLASATDAAPARPAALAAPVALGALRAVPVDVAPALRTGRLEPPRQLNLPPGFQANAYANNVRGARFMAYGPGNLLYVSGMAVGRVYALPDRNADGVADEVATWADGLNLPHGLAVKDGHLYVAETNRVVRFRLGPNGERQGGPEAVVPDLPTGDPQRTHRTRTIGFGPDGKLYVAVGSTCNVCTEADERRATVLVYDGDGKNGRIFMRGLRNAVGFVWRPGTPEIWATNNGRDHLGDDMPPETIYQLRDGADAGWPRCLPGGQLDPEHGRGADCGSIERPRATFQAHSAPLGLRFYDGRMFPEAARGDMFVALHGSWNRTSPVGYKLLRIPFASGTAGQPEDFATGFMANEGNRGSVWARPVDVLVAPDGALLVSDDDGGTIIRITHRPA